MQACAHMKHTMLAAAELHSIGCPRLLSSSPAWHALQVSLVAISLLGDPLAPAPLSPITNTAGPYGGMQQQLASPPAPTLGMGMGMPGMGMLPPQAQPQYMQPPLAGQAPPYMQPPPPVHQQQQQQQPYLQPQHQAPPLGAPPTKEESAAALAAELGVDPVTAQRIAELQQQKQEVRVHMWRMEQGR